MCSTRLPSLAALPLTHPCTLAPTQAIIREQAAQRELKLTMAKAEKDDDDAYDAYAESARKMGQYTDAEVQAAHTAYVGALKKLFDAHKAEFGFGDRELVVG